jgi:hypothetical protein
MSAGSYTTSLLVGLFLVILFAVLSVFVWLWAVRRPPQSPPPDPDYSAPAQPPTPVYVALGISNVNALRSLPASGDDWPDLLRALLPPETNYLKLDAADTLASTNAQSLQAAIAAAPTTVTLWQVAGDATGGTSLPAYLAELRVTLRRLVEETDATIFLLNLPDLSLFMDTAAEDRKSLVRGGVEQWNRVISEVAMPHGNRVLLVDLYPHTPAILDPQHGNAALADLVLQQMKAPAL